MKFAYSLPIIDDTGILEKENIVVESIKVKVIDEFKSLDEIAIGNAVDDAKVPERLKNQQLIKVPLESGEELLFRKLHCTKVPNEAAKSGDLGIVWIREK